MTRLSRWGSWFEGEGAIPPGWVRPAPDAAQRRRDVVVGVLLAAGSVVSVVLHRSLMAPDDRPQISALEAIAWCVAVALPLTVRRRFPLSVLLACSAAFIGMGVRGASEGLTTQIALFLALFTAGAWARERTVGRAGRAFVVIVMFCWLAYGLSAAAWEDVREDAGDGPLPAVLATVLFVTITNVLFFGGAWAFGDLAWRSAGQRALLEQRNAELALERDENARRAVLDERVRIARELHDVLAHHVSVMGVQAGAARVVLASDPDAARTALAGVEQAARDAVGEMRHLLGVLRSAPDRPGDAPGDGRVQRPEGDLNAGAGDVWGEGPRPVPVEGAPVIDHVDVLIAAARAGGLRAECTVVGEALPLPPSVSVSAYRIVQEALTNTLRHAGASRVDVRLRYFPVSDGPVSGGPVSDGQVSGGVPAAFEVEVVDDGRLVAAPVAAVGAPDLRAGGGRRSGLGLMGMRERAGMHGAELEAGPRPEGGFRVRVRFPLPAREVVA